MGMHAAYHNKADGTAQWLQRPSQWGSCMAVYQNHDGNTIAAEDTIDGVLDNHIYVKAFGDMEASRRVVSLIIKDQFFKNLVNDPKFRLLKTFDKVKGLEWSTNFNNVDHKSLIHFGFNGEAGASGLITGFRYLNTVLVYMFNHGATFRPQLLPDDLVPLACFLFVASQSRNFGSDGSLSLLPATGADFNEYCRDREEDPGDVYYDDFTDWLYDHRPNILHNAQVARIFKRSKEDMLALSWQTDSLARFGYMKDEQLPGNKDIPDDSAFNMSISAPLYADYEDGDVGSGEFTNRVTEEALRQFKHDFLN